MNGILDGITIDTAPSRAEEADRKAATDRLAASMVRKLTMPHSRRCMRDCLHRNHRRDHAHLAETLDILGLADDQARPGDYESSLEWASMSRSEAVNMTGRTYGDN